jgi:hypothetical protein
MLIGIGGRMARLYVAETQGVHQPEWTVEQVGNRMQEIRDPAEPWVFPVVPSGQMGHILRSFQMARES